MADSVLVVTSGLTLITSQLLALGVVAPSWLQWGVGTTAPAAANVDLETKTDCNEDRVDGTDSVETTTLDDDTYRVVGTITKEDAIAAITEVGTFNAASVTDPPDGDTMFLRATFSAINLVIGNSIAFTIDTKFVPVATP